MTNFWEVKKLSEMSTEEWESLCDSCGKCCLHKLEDEDTKEVFFTWVSCKYLDLNSCKCTDYSNRLENVPRCLKITNDNLSSLAPALPETCAYRLLNEGKKLYDWHPLINTSQFNFSIRGISISENDVDLDNLEDFLIEP